VTDPAALAREPFCYVTTSGRVSGRPHTIEIWFAIEKRTLYILSGGRDRSDWVRNLMRAPAVSVRIGGEELTGRGRVVAGGEEDGLARRLLLAKYGPTYTGDLSDWGRSALPVAIDLAVDW
jgi:deazaflavin-dependent oxidoreductase (nitroreductase family)